jgi:hypothetical protein
VIPAEDFDPVAPGLKREAPAVEKTAAGAAQARKIVEAAVAAMGGREALAGIKDLSVKGALKLFTPQGEMAGDSVEEILYPDKYKAVLGLPFGKITQMTDSEKAWMGQGAALQEAPEQAKGELLKSVVSAATVGLLREALAGKAEVNALPQAEVNGKKFDALQWSAGGHTVKMLFDAATALPARLNYRGAGMSGPAEIETVYEDWRDVSGVKLPFKETVYQNGQKFVERVASERRVNSGLDPAGFKKPE